MLLLGGLLLTQSVGQLGRGGIGLLGPYSLSSKAVFLSFSLSASSFICVHSGSPPLWKWDGYAVTGRDRPQ